MGFDVDLRALMLKASKAGVHLSLRFERNFNVTLQGERNGFWIARTIQFYELTDMWLDQGRAFDRAVDELIYRLNEAEEKLIEKGEYEQ